MREIWPPLEKLESENFKRVDWSVEHAVLWIAYRNPTLFHFLGVSGPRVQAEFSSAERRDSAPEKTLLNALKTGKLKAIRNGQEIQPEDWFGSRQLQAKSDYFRRSDVMRIFKDKPLNSKDENEAKKLLARHFRDKPNITRADAKDFLRSFGLRVCPETSCRIA